MAVPKRKKSRSNTRARRSQWKATAPHLVACSRCRDMKRQHTVCHTCGTYDGRQVLQPS